MVSRIFALLVWAAVAASAAYWGLRWFARPMAVPPGTDAVSLNTIPRGDITKLLSRPAVVANAAPDPSAQSVLAGRIKLLGVVAPRYASGVGVALLTVDGRPAQAFKLGHRVDGEMVLQSITQTKVDIGPSGGPASLSLDLPLLPPPATGTLASLSTSPGQSNMAMQGIPNQGMPPGGGGMADTPIEGAEPAPSEAAHDSATPTPPRLPSRIRRFRSMNGDEPPPPQ